MKTLFINRKATEAIALIQKAQSESEVLDALALKEEIDWNLVHEELKDEWNDYFGDAQKYLP